nr:PREDICTED: A disintegrin and metalloproteinase with thrombospondin motifs 2-like isoform X2 [Linepithema humile]
MRVFERVYINYLIDNLKLNNAKSNMIFILNFVLIILLNETYAYVTQDIEIILLPSWNSTGVKEIPLTLKVFGQLIQLNLRRNDRIVSPVFQVWKYNSKNVTEMLSQINALDTCFYFHEDHVNSAAINFCQEYGLEGLVFLENDTLEIRPLRNDFPPLIDGFCDKEQINFSFGLLHRIKRSQQYFADSDLNHLHNIKPKRRNVQNMQQKLTIELAIFFDEAAYRIYMPLLDNDEKRLHDMILAYVNQIQAVLHHPSFGTPIDISLIRLDMMKKQPPNLPVFNGEAGKLYDSFCKYARALNPPDDNDPHHWDIGIYLTGINIFTSNDQEKYYHILGRSFVDGACNSSFSYAIIEFGIQNQMFSSGFSSSLIAAHEIGHLLGMEHESKCEEYKYVMSPKRSYRGQVTWSECNRNITKELWKTKSCLRDRMRPKYLDDVYALDHSRYHDLPGRKWTAKAQCELFFHDKDASVVTLFDICQILQCDSPRKNTYFSGPALDGTYCAVGKECRGGECVPIIVPPYNFKFCRKDNWSKWKKDSCNSYCLEKSKGAVVKRRFCKHRTYRTANCKGPYYDVVLCDDSSLCTEKRKTIAEFTTTKCTTFSNIMLELKKEPGWQAAHEVDKPWIACTIYCVRKNFSTYYAPRLEMLDFGINPYFPDGTWCHREHSQDYFCRMKIL